MPMPVSVMVNVRASSSSAMRMANSASGSTTSSGCRVSISNWRRLSASEALEINSRRKISRSV